MAKTVRQLYNRALELLNVAAAGQSPAAEDWEAVRAVLPPLLAELYTVAALNLRVTANNEEASDIPDEVFGPLANLLANDAGPSFGIPAATGIDRDLKLVRPIRQVTYGGPQYFPQDVNYF